MSETITATRIIDLDLWEGRLPRLVENYRSAKPFPHTVLDAFLDRAAADQAQQTSQVAYSDGFEGAARRIARIVEIDRANVVPLDESTRVVAGTDVSVVVTMAQDKAQ